VEHPGHPESPEDLGHVEPKRVELADQEEAVLTLGLVEGHKETSRLGCLDLSFGILCKGLTT